MVFTILTVVLVILYVIIYVIILFRYVLEPDKETTTIAKRERRANSQAVSVSIRIPLKGDGQMIDNEDYICARLQDLLEVIEGSDRAMDLTLHAGFDNGVFKMKEYVMDACNCSAAENDYASGGECDPTCTSNLPNFEFGNGILTIRWYKHIGRGMEIDQKLSRKQLREIFAACDKSIETLNTSLV